VADLLSALGGHQHHWALRCLQDMAGKPTNGRQ
jgi:hypothetical protein